uniref:Uncharacterized protein n=1 Tax=Ceratitis capitata TaxID=7213 RepID=W8BYB2_CERCA
MELALRHTRPAITLKPATLREGVISLYATIIDRVRKWEFHYDGGKYPLGFIERVEEFTDSYPSCVYRDKEKTVFAQTIKRTLIVSKCSSERRKERRRCESVQIKNINNT